MILKLLQLNRRVALFLQIKLLVLIRGEIVICGYIQAGYLVKIHKH